MAVLSKNMTSFVSADLASAAWRSMNMVMLCAAISLPSESKVGSCIVIVSEQATQANASWQKRECMPSS
jgi:hypothetical protein